MKKIKSISRRFVPTEIIKKSLGFGFLFGIAFSFILFFLLPFVAVLGLSETVSSGAVNRIESLYTAFGFLFSPFTFCTTAYKKVMEDVCIPGNQPSYCPVECGLGGGFLTSILFYAIIGIIITFLILKYKQRKA